jgi:hypothetical protein
MRVKITLYYGEDEASLVGETDEYEVPTQAQDLESFEEAQTHLVENIVEPYAEEGFDLVDDLEEEAAVGVDYVMALTLESEPFETRAGAQKFLARLIGDIETNLADLE